MAVKELERGWSMFPPLGAAAYDHAVLYCSVAIPENGFISPTRNPHDPLTYDLMSNWHTAYQTSHVKKI